MSVSSVFLSLLVTIVTGVLCQVQTMTHAPPVGQPRQPGQVGQGAPPANHGSPHRLRDKNHIQDPSHIKEHYDGVMDSEANMSEDELNFHYFKVHDYDNNNKLDGIELISALTHYHDNQKEGAPPSPEEPRMPDQELINMIDLIMEEDDADKDGYVDYPEFIISQRG